MTGIMMSISTMSMSGARSSAARASAPLSADVTVGLAPLEQRRQGEDVAEVVVDHQHLRPARRVRQCRHRCLGSGTGRRRRRSASSATGGVVRAAAASARRGTVGAGDAAGRRQVDGERAALARRAVTVISPPSRPTSSRLIDSPSPVPP